MSHRRIILLAVLGGVVLLVLLSLNARPLQDVSGCVEHKKATSTDLREGSDVADLEQGSPREGETKKIPEETPLLNREAPYGEFCETRPRGEKQLWNMRKKVISFSLFLPNDQKGQDIPEYLIGGLVANIRLAQLYYPEWIVRVYVLNLRDDQIETVLALDDKTLEVVKCHDDSPLNQMSNAGKMITRFLVVDDPTVEYSAIRDLDSRPSIRELLAVNEWISSDMGFHTMRDHDYHIIPIMGCSWGAKRGTIDMTEAVKRALRDHPNGSNIPGCCACDQNFLTSYVWNNVKNNAIDHDMQPGRCQQMGSKVCRQYPITSRHNEYIFVGYPFKDGTRDTHFECAVDCKPTNDPWYTGMTTSND